jgi:MFS family permease
MSSRVDRSQDLVCRTWVGFRWGLLSGRPKGPVSTLRALPPVDHEAEARLWNPDFRLFFVARTTSLLGDQMLPIAITAALVHTRHGMSGVGYALAAHIAPFAILLIFGGVLSDRFGARRLMIVSDAARLVFQAALALLLMLGEPELWQMLVLLALLGAGGATFQPGVASMIPRLAKDVQRANAVLRVAESSTIVIGPSVAGLLLVFLSPSAVMAVDAVTYAVSGVCLYLIRTNPVVPGVGSSFRGDLVTGWREFRSRTWLWGVITVFMLWQVSSAGPTLTVAYSTIALRHGDAVLGLVISALGVGNVLGGFVAIRFRPRHPLRTGTFGLAMFLLLPFGTGLGVPAVVLGLFCLVGGAGMAFWGVMFHTSVQTHVPLEVLGRVHAFDAAGSLVMKPVGQAVSGPVSLVIGVAPVLFIATGAGVVACALLLLVPAIRNLEGKNPRSGQQFETPRATAREP